MPPIPPLSHALILAAGLGSRLRPLTDEQPKALVDIDGCTILGRLLERCAQAGLSQAILVSGYQRARLEAWAEAYRGPLQLRCVHNAHYASRGNAWSLAVARELLEGQAFVKLDGDVLLGPGLLEDLLAHPQPSAIALDGRATIDEEAMKARLTAGGMVSALGKWLPLESGAGESIGVEKIAAADSARLFQAIEECVLRQGQDQAYYEDVYHQMVADGWPLGALCLTPQHWWGEIDTLEDLEQIRQQLKSCQA